MPTTPIGGGVDGPNYADYFDSADTNQIAAASTNLREILHMVKDTSILFITEMGGQLQIYNTNPGNPTLAPMVQLRKSTFVTTDFSDQEIDARMQGFIQKLPPKLREALLADMKLPDDQRSEKLVVFEDMLRSMAEISLWASNFNAMNASGVNEPTSAALFRMVKGATNGIQVLENTHAKIQAEHDLMPEIDPNRVVLGEYLNILAKLISAAKAFLQAMQVTDAEKDKDYSIAQREGALKKLADQLEMFQKAASAKAKKATMDLVMKITGPIIGVLVLVATLLSGGTLLSLAITVMVSALSMADSFTGFMTTGLQKFMNSMPSPMKEIVMVALIIVIVAATKGAGASKLAQKLTPEVMKKGAQMASEKAAESCAKMAAMQMGMMLASTSGVITTICTEFSKAVCKDSKEAEIIAMVMQLLVMLSMALLCGKWMGNIDSTKAAMLCDIIADSLSVGTKAYSAVNHIKIGELAKEKADIQAAITLLETALELFGLSKKEIAAARKQLNELAQLWSDLFNNIIQKGLQINAALAQAG